jgi:hypothetical protein
MRSERFSRGQSCSDKPLAGLQWPQNASGTKTKKRDGDCPVAFQPLYSLVQALRAPCCQAETGLAGDPSEVTALGVRHWITSFHC